MLAYTNAAIDAVQNAKSQFLSTFVKEEAFKKPLQAFVDAQTIFTKQVAKSANDVVEAATKYDYSKIAKTFSK